MKTIKRMIPVLFGLFLSVQAFAQTDPAATAVMSNLKQKYPKTVFKSISQTPLPGIYEVVMGKNVAYVEESGRYFLFGHLFDMQNQTDLTAEKHGPASDTSGSMKTDYKSLPFKDAIKIVRGKGRREIAVFSDPDCPYCKQLENTLSSVEDITIHLFMFPIDQLHSQARKKCVSVWCAKDRVKAWTALMTKGEVPKNQECENPVARNIALAEKLNIHGTPTIILSDGTVLPGAVSAMRMEELFSELEKKAKAEKK